MFTGTQTIFIPVKREIVFSVAETYPYFVRFFGKRSRIVSQTETTMSVEVYSRLLGFFPSYWEGKGIKERNRQIRFVQTKGFFEGLVALWVFSDEGEGTKAEIQTNFSKPNLPQFLEHWLGSKVVEATTQKILDELKNACLEKTLSRNGLR